MLRHDRGKDRLELVTVYADAHGGLCGIPEKLHGIRTVGIMAASAVEFFVGPLGVFLAFLIAEGVSRAGNTFNRVRFFLHIPVAVQANQYRFFKKQRQIVGGVRAVATHAHAACNRRMNISLTELSFIVAAHAKVRWIRFDELRIVG